MNVLIVAIVSVLLVVILFYTLLIVPTKWLKVERIRQPLGLGLKIVQLSDLHVEHIRVKPERLARLLAEEKPDYVMVTGDFTQKEQYFRLVDRYANVLARVGCPVYIVLGNHDHKLPRISRLIKRLEQRGLNVLRNESVRLEKFELVGIDDYDSGHHQIERAFRGMRRDRPVIVITHDPNIVLEIKEPYDYLLSGHLHGKQVNVPYLFRLRPAGPLPAMGIYKGLHRAENGTYYISKGLSQTGFNIRFAVRAEVTVHEL